MQTNKDQVDAHRFAVRRMSSALLTGDTGQGTSPLRSTSTGLLIGVVLSVIIAAVMLLFGLIKPRPDLSWQTQGGVVVDKQTGTRFLYLDDRLRPTLNYASALLGGTGKAPVLVAHDLVESLPVGSPVGIPGAPDVLPTSGSLLSGAYAVCVVSGADGGVRLDLDPDRTATAFGATERLVVRGPAEGGRPGGLWVLIQGTRHQVPSAASAVALGLTSPAPVEVGRTWLESVPDGAPLTPLALPGLGDPGPAVAGRATRVGDVVEVTAGALPTRYVVTTDGFAPVTATDAALQEGLTGRPAVRATAAEVASRMSAAEPSAGRPDVLAGGLVDVTGRSVCLSYPPVGSTAAPTLVTLPASSAPVTLPAGSGLVVADPDAGAGIGTSSQPAAWLIASDGRRYPFASSTELGRAGYAEVVRTLPASVLAIVPTGPTLSVDGARRSQS